MSKSNAPLLASNGAVFSSFSTFRLRLERWEGGELRVCDHDADLWETDLRQQRRQPVLLRAHRAHPARAGVGDVASIDEDKSLRHLLV